MSQDSVVLLPGHGDVRLAVDRLSRESARSVILLHGGGQTRHAWGATAHMLFDCGYDVRSMDLRGHGDSDWSREPDYSFAAFRDDVLTIAGDLERPVLVGASLGGIAALLAAGEGVGFEIGGLVLVDIAPTRTANGADTISAFMRSAPDGFASIEDAASAISTYLPHRRRPPRAEGLMKNLRQRDGRFYWHWDPAFLEVTARDRGDQDERLKAATRAIKAPVLLVRGEHSEIVAPEDVVALKALAPHAEIVEIAGAHHMVAGDQNTQFGKAVLEFVLRTAPPQAI